MCKNVNMKNKYNLWMTFIDGKYGRNKSGKMNGSS
jgi:hypothetical protein